MRTIVSDATPSSDVGVAAEAEAIRLVLRALVDAWSLGEPFLLSLWRRSRLTLTQMRVLSALARGQANAGELARAVGVPGSSLTRLLEKLEGRGLITRSGDPGDRRRVVVEVTAAGRDTLGGTATLSTSDLGRAAAEMTPDEREAFVWHVSRFVERARRIADLPDPAAAGTSGARRL